MNVNYIPTKRDCRRRSSGAIRITYTLLHSPRGKGEGARVRGAIMRSCVLDVLAQSPAAQAQVELYRPCESKRWTLSPR